MAETLWKLSLLVAAAAPLAEAYHSCNNQCSLDEQNRFWSDCCCVHCSSGDADDDDVPWWACCDADLSLCLFLGLVPVLMLQVGKNFWFWVGGHALFPTSIVELSRSNGSNGRKPIAECGPKETLSGWRIVRNVNFPPQPTVSEYNNDTPKREVGFSSYGYSAMIQLYNERGETIDVNVPLKSFAAYQQLENYCKARQGKCYEISTKDLRHPTHGYHLITFLLENQYHLYLYRPYFYHAMWKFQLLVSGLFSFLATLGLCDAAPKNLQTLGIVGMTYGVSVLLGGAIFYFFGAHDVAGACGNFSGYKSYRPNIHDYVDFADNPGLTSNNTRPVA